MPINVSIVEDNDGVRESLGQLISGSFGFNLASSFKDAESAMEGLPGSKADVILMDINLPGKSGIECTYIIKELLPQVQIVMLTVYEDFDNIFESLKAGASGYLLKRTPPAKLLEAIEDVYKGGAPMTSQIARMIVQTFRQNVQKAEDITQAPGKCIEENQAVEENKGSEDLNLSRREHEILHLLSRGYRYKEISEALFISIDTVRSHIKNIYGKLQVRSRTEAMLKYMEKQTL